MLTPETIPAWVSLVGNFGFPIALSIYLFARFESKLDKLERVIINLSDTIKSLTK